MTSLLQISFSQPLFNWLKEHLLPCPFKYITGVDCPGCGFQRSLLALAQGNFSDSFALYPPAIPFLLALIYFFADKKLGLDTRQNLIKKIVYVVVASLMLVSYWVKMYHLYGDGSSV